ncbi:MAG: AAA family ATPase [Gemmataceae bacterium]
MSALDRYRKTSSNGQHHESQTERSQRTKSRSARATTSERTRFEFIDSAAFAEGDYRAEWLIKGVLVKGEPAVAAGASKSLKTTICGVDLGVSLASGTPFLGRFSVPNAVHVAIASGESGARTLQETAKRICQAKGFTLESLGPKLQWCFSVPILSDGAAMTEFVDGLAERGVQACIIDPLYLALGSIDAKNMFEVGGVLRVVSVMLAGKGISPIVLHHANRRNNTFDPMELTDIAYSGCDQFARQFLLLSRREKYLMDGNHRLWLKIGGSAGHGGLFGVDVCEGITGDDFGGRRWEVRVESAGDLAISESERRERQKSDRKRTEQLSDEATVLQVIDQNGETAVTKTKIRDSVSFSRARADSAVERLKASGRIVMEVGEVVSGKGTWLSSEVFRRRQDGEDPTPQAVDFF